jgi:hypothetical protein
MYIFPAPAIEHPDSPTGWDDTSMPLVLLSDLYLPPLDRDRSRPSLGPIWPDPAWNLPEALQN